MAYFFLKSHPLHYWFTYLNFFMESGGCLLWVISLCLCTCVEVIQQLQIQLLESERRNADYVQRFHKMQTDYCNLTETTAELVDALEATISGKTVGVTEAVTKAEFAQLYKRWFPPLTLYKLSSPNDCFFKYPDRWYIICLIVSLCLLCVSDLSWVHTECLCAPVQQPDEAEHRLHQAWHCEHLFRLTSCTTKNSVTNPSTADTICQS